MSLERAYRRLLLAYPAHWRAQRAEEVLSVLLDTAEARGARRPSAAEALDLVGHGLLARTAGLGAVLDARTRELTALLALASLTALSLLCLLMAEWWPWPVTPLPPEAMPEPAVPVSDWPGTPGPFLTLGGPLFLALLLPALLAMAGRPRAGRLLLLGLVPVVVAVPLIARVLELNRPALWTLCGLLAFSGLALLAPVRRGALLAVLSAAMSAAALCAVVANSASGSDERSDFYYSYDRLQNLVDHAPLAVALVLAFAAGRRAVLPAALVGACWLATLAAQSGARGSGRSLSLPLATGAVGLCLVALCAALYRRGTGPEPAR